MNTEISRYPTSGPSHAVPKENLPLKTPHLPHSTPRNASNALNRQATMESQGQTNIQNPKSKIQHPAPMATQNQIDANRRNAQKSTGPTTPEGRAAVRLN